MNRIQKMEQERLKFSIARFDHYYDSINNKCAVYLALGTFLVGGLVAAYPRLVELFHFGIALHVVMSLILICGLTSIIIVAWTLTPYRGKHYKSLLYFRSIAEMGELEFTKASKNNKRNLGDLRRQAYALSTGLSSKFARLRVAGILFALQLLLCIPFITMLIFNLK